MKKLALLVVFGVFTLTSKSQTLVSSAGGVMKNSQVVINYSIGENFIASYSTPNEITSEGFEQYVSSIPTAVVDSKNKSILFIYQSTGYINYYNVPLEDNYQYSLVAMSGQKVLEGQLNGEPINATAIHSGTYLIVVKSKEQQIGVYKLLIY